MSHSNSEKPFESTSVEQTAQLAKILEALIYAEETHDLIKVILEKISSLFTIDDVGLFEIREDGWHRDFAVDYYNHNNVSSSIKSAGLTGFLPPDNALNSLLEEAKIVDFKVLMNEFSDHPHFPFLWEGGLREFISAPMYYGGKLFGVFILWSKEKGRFVKKNIPLFKEVTKYLSVSLRQIVDRENIAREKKFKETLLSITEAIASANTPKQLYKNIFERIKPVFSYDELGLFVLDDSGDFHYELIDQEVLETPISQIIIEENLGKHTKYRHKGSTADWLMRKGLSVVSLRELNEKTQHPQLKYMIEAGLKQMIAAPLENGGKAFGILCFNSLIDDFYKEEDLVLFNNIAEQISVAVSNILANEKVLSEKFFKEKLLNISTAVSNISNRKELFRVIFEDLKTLLDFDNAGLFYIDVEKDVFFEVLDEGTVDDVQNTLARNNLLGPFSYSGANKDALIYMDEVGIVDVMEQSKIYPNPQWEIMIKSGLKKMLVSPLNLGGKRIGFICFNTKQTDLYSEDDYRLVGAIAEQVSIALGNVMANENIQKREQEKTQLLQITQKVNELRNLNDFLRFSAQNLQSIFKFHDVGVFILTEDKKYHYDLVGVDPSISPSNWSFALANEGTELVEHKDSLIEWMIETIAENDNLMLFDFEDLQQKFPDYYQFQLLDFIEAGYRDCLAANLRVGDTIYGMFCINALKKDYFDASQFRLFQNVVEQLSVAVSNILASGQLLQEKEFSDTLLNLTESIASSNNPLELYKTLNDSIKNVIPFEQVGLLLLDPSKEYHFELINERFDTSASYTARELDKATRYKHKNTSVAWLMENGPVIVAMDTLVKTTEHPRHKDMVAAGVKTLLGGPLIANGEMFGMLAFKSKKENTYNEDHLQFYKAISKQVAVTTSNILANKEIIKKNELQSLELRLSSIITKEEEIAEKWSAILDELKGFIPFSYALILDTSEDKERNLYRYEWVSSREKRFLDIETLSKIKNVEVSELRKWEKDLSKYAFPESNFLNELEAKKGVSKTSTSKLGYKAVLKHDIVLKKEKHMIQFFLFSRNNQTFLKEHSDVLRSIQNTLQLSLEKMFANISVKNLSDQLKLEKDYLQIAVKEAYNFNEMVGDSSAMRSIFKKITEVSQVDATVLLLGETGTGKELIARAIHENSDREDKVLIKVNCAAIPAQIVESELFGHEKGAFTGAVQRRIGKFELAHKGTIFLDEIGEMPLELQTKLLRVLQERELERLGSNDTIKLDFRVIAATNRNLEEEVANGKFRADLFYRLNSFPILVPPLRERGDDVLLIADFFSRQASERFGLPFKGFTQNTLNRLKKYSWPGNVRELQNVIEQAIISQRGKVLEIYPGRSNIPGIEKLVHTGGLVNETLLQDDSFDMEVIKKEKDKVERAYLLKVLESTKWRVSGKNGAAQKLGVAPSTLESRMRKLDITRS
ncbi:sigma 54-interacting transcriptional regulator [uncultured Aquimarina sp.]|uniref:sigma-54-dependent Fis family transcriptional regulator n=1 Tax=uncultured Aquimarina sp. TaxID=575652 RepID=UPI002614653A|nr:sigma 54-interacting transcriptional regulator [uncultured Aquimarina sp.]